MRRPKTSVLALALLLALPLLLGARPVPRPVGPDGRAEVRIARLHGIGPLEWATLDDLGFMLERGRGGEVTAWLAAEEMDKLDALGIRWTELAPPAAADDPAPGTEAAAHYTYETLTTELQRIADTHPGITRLTSAGKSVQGRELWWMKVSRTPDLDEDEPGFKYVSSMHGDEVVGMEMCVRLIRWLTERYPSDARVARLVDGAEIWIMPLMNPDGRALQQRTNAQGVDLNRDFPDMYDDPVDTTAGRATETGLMMDWQAAHATVLSANFHGGALVANYPYDNNPTGAPVYSASPDDDTYIDLALDYSEDNPPMFRGDGGFPQGITNGADWYAVSGGMQDWNYHWRGDMDMTLEISLVKTPSPTTLDQYWEENRDSMLSYLERALTGVRGRVTDAVSGAPVRATMKITGRDEVFFSEATTGNYHRPIVAGSWQVEAHAPGYESDSAGFSVAAPRADAVRRDLALVPIPARLEYAGQRLASGGGADGFLDPGESGQLAVTLRDDGGAAAGVSGTLRSLDRYALAGSSATWPDIAAGASAESNPPHCALTAAPDTPAGHKLVLLVDWAAASGGGIAGATAPFLVALGAPERSDTPSTDTPRAIPNPGLTESRLTIPFDREIADVNVRVDITHPYRGDLRVSLIAPGGEIVRLHDRTGGFADDIHTWYDTLTPAVDDLRVLNGTPSLGSWTLRVEDLAAGNAGTLTGWGLQLFTRPWEDPVPEVTLRSVTRVGGRTRIEWWPVGSAHTYIPRRAADPLAAESFANVTAEDDDPADTRFDDASPDVPGAATFFLVNANGHTGEGLWGHYGR